MGSGIWTDEDEIIAYLLGALRGQVFDRSGLIFAMGRISGWSAHRMEELINMGKIIRPAYKYVGGRNDYAPLNER